MVLLEYKSTPVPDNRSDGTPLLLSPSREGFEIVFRQSYREPAALRGDDVLRRHAPSVSASGRKRKVSDGDPIAVR